MADDSLSTEIADDQCSQAVSTALRAYCGFQQQIQVRITQFIQQLFNSYNYAKIVVVLSFCFTIYLKILQISFMKLNGAVRSCFLQTHFSDCKLVISAFALLSLI